MLLLLLLFSRSQLIFYFSPNCFLRHNLKHASAVYAKHRQVLTNTKKSLLRNFSVLWDKKNSKNRHTSLYAQSFSMPETFRNRRVPLQTISELSDKKSWRIVTPQFRIIFSTTKIHKHQMGPLLNFWQTKISLFLWYPPLWFTRIFAPDKQVAPETSEVPKGLHH